MSHEPLKTTAREPAKRRISICASIAMIAALGAGLPLGPASAEPIEVSVSRLPLNAERAQATRLGRLVYRGGLELASDASRFGGYSGMVMSADGARMIAISDRGAWLTARLDYDDEGRLIGMSETDLELMALPTGNVPFDPEAMVLSADGSILVSTERDHRLLRYADDRRRETDAFADDAHGLSRRVPVELPAAADFSVMPSNGGIETLARLADGRLLAIEEGADGDADGVSHAWLIGPDGEDAPLAYQRANNFRPTDGVILPNGDLLCLERRYTTIGGVAGRLKLIPAGSIAPGATLEGKEIATLIPPVNVDNMEALAVYERDGEIRLLILSDDNFNPLQRTLLLQFALVAE